MSSILDALQKLEEEKARERELEAGEVEETTAAAELTGRDRRLAGIPSAAIVALAVCFFIATVATSAVVAVMLSRAGPSAQQDVAAVPDPSAVPAAPVTPEPNPAGAAPESGEAPVPPSTATEPSALDGPVAAAAEDIDAELRTMSERTERPAPESAPPAEVEPPPQAYDPAPTFVPAPTPPPAFNDSPAPAETAPPSQTRWTPPEPAYQRPAAPGAGPPEVMTDATRRQLGLPELEIIFVAQGEDPSRSMALINHQKVYINDVIPGTPARVTDIQIRGVEIEVGGQRYFLRK